MLLLLVNISIHIYVNLSSSLSLYYLKYLCIYLNNNCRSISTQSGKIDIETLDYVPHTSAERLSINTAANHGLLIVDADFTDVPAPPAYIAVESHVLLHSRPLVDVAAVASVLDTRTGQQLSASQAFDDGLLNYDDRRQLCYVHPMTGLSSSLTEAVDDCYVTLRNEHDATAQGDEDLCARVTSVLDTLTGEYVDRDGAVRFGMLDTGRGVYVDRRTTDVINLREALRRGLVKVDPGNSTTSNATTTTTTTTTTDYRIREVLNPVTGEWVPASSAVRMGILDLARGTYINKVTGVSRPLHEAYRERLIIADDESVEAKRCTASLVHSVYDHANKSPISLQRAVERGIITSDLTEYVVSETRQHITLREAVQRGLIIMSTTAATGATEEIVESQLLYEGVKSFTLKSVIDTRSGEEISMSDAIRHQIVNRERGEYIDMAADRVLTIDAAVARGLVMISRVEHSADEMANVGVATQVYSLLEVRDTRYDRVYAPAEAESRGLLNKRRGLYTDTLSGDTMSIGDAIQRGFIAADLLDNPDYALLDDGDCYATLTRHHTGDSVSPTSNANDAKRHIGGVVDVSTGGVVSIIEAVKRGIIDPAMGVYTLSTTGEKMTLRTAIARGFVCDYASYPQPHRTAIVQAIYDSASERWLYPDEARRQGLLEGDTLLYKGQRISMKQAEQSGLLRILSAASDQRREDEDVHFTVETETSYITPMGEDAVPPLTLARATAEGLVENGVYRQGTQTYTVAEALRKGFIVADEKSSVVTSVVDAIEDGRVNVAKKEFVHLGLRMSVKAACKLNLLLPERVGVDLTLKEAMARDLLDPTTALFADPNSGRVYDVDAAMREGFLSRQNAAYNLEGATGFGEALRGFMISEDLCSFKHPLHRRLFSLEDAITLGYVCVAPSELFKQGIRGDDATSTTTTSTTSTRVERVTLNTDGTIVRMKINPASKSFDADNSDTNCRLDNSFHSIDSKVSDYLRPVICE